MFKSIPTPHTDRGLILKLCNVATLNSTVAENNGMNSIPIVQGMAFRSDMSTCVPCHFLDHQRGPELEVRMFSWASGGASCDDYGIYDEFDDFMVSSDFEYDSDSDYDSDDDNDDIADATSAKIEDLTIWDDNLQSVKNNSESAFVNNISSTSDVIDSSMTPERSQSQPLRLAHWI